LGADQLLIRDDLKLQLIRLSTAAIVLSTSTACAPELDGRAVRGRMISGKTTDAVEEESEVEIEVSTPIVLKESLQVRTRPRNPVLSFFSKRGLSRRECV